MTLLAKNQKKNNTAIEKIQKGLRIIENNATADKPQNGSLLNSEKIKVLMLLFLFQYLH